MQKFADKLLNNSIEVVSIKLNKSSTQKSYNRLFQKLEKN